MTDATHHGLLLSATEVLRDRTRAVVELVTAAGAGAVGALPSPVAGAVTHLVAALGDLANLAPPITAELDVLASELRAKRLSVQALQAELVALDGQLGVLEASLAPVLGWSHQWDRTRHALVDAVSALAATAATATQGE